MTMLWASCVATIEMPTDEPMLRIRLKSEAASARYLRVQRREGDRRERHEDEAEAEPLHHPGDHDRPAVHQDGEPGHLPERDRGQAEAGQDQEPRVDLADQPPDDDHRDHRPDAARRQHHAGRHHRIAHHPLQHRRQQREPREQDHPHHEDHGQRHHQVGVAEDRRVDERVLAADDVDHEGPEPGERQARGRSRSPARRTSRPARRGPAGAAARRWPATASRSRRSRSRAAAVRSAAGRRSARPAPAARPAG